MSKAEVAKHAGGGAGVWIIVNDAVYDVTRFIADHPGGAGRSTSLVAP